MAPFNPTLVFSSLLFALMGLACPTHGGRDNYWEFESPWEDLPRWSKDWSRSDMQTAIDRATQARAYGYPLSDRKSRMPRSVSSPPSSCASGLSKQNAGASPAASVAGYNQNAEISQRSGPADYGYYNEMQQGPQLYSSGGSVFQQHPNLDQFNRKQSSSSWAPESANLYGRSNEPSKAYNNYDQYANQQLDQFSQSYNPSTHSAGQSSESAARSSAYYLIPSDQSQQYYSRSSGGSRHPVQTLPDIIETPSSKSASQYTFYSPASLMDSNQYRSSYRAEGNPHAHQPQTAEDVNSIKTTNPAYNNYASQYYRQQIQQALADGKQLVAGLPNGALNQQLAPGIDKISVQPVYTTPSFPVTTLAYDPEEMRKVYGQYYVPPVFNLVQRQPNSFEVGNNGVVRDVLQYLLNQYQTNGVINNGITSGHRNQRLLPDISTKHERILHGIDPIQKLPRQSLPQLPSFTGDNQFLPPNMYRSDKWEPKTNLVVHDPVNLGEFEQSGMNQMMGQYARSSPCSRSKRELGGVWGYYPQLTPGGARMTEPMFQSSQNAPAMYGQPGLEGSYMGRTAVPGLPGYDDPLRQSMGFGQQPGGYGQPMGGLGQPMGGFGQSYGNHAYPDYYNYQGRDAVSGLEQFISGITQFVPMMGGNGPPIYKK